METLWFIHSCFHLSIHSFYWLFVWTSIDSGLLHMNVYICFCWNSYGNVMIHSFLLSFIYSFILLTVRLFIHICQFDRFLFMVCLSSKQGQCSSVVSAELHFWLFSTLFCTFGRFLHLFTLWDVFCTFLYYWIISTLFCTISLHYFPH